MESVKPFSVLTVTIRYAYEVIYSQWGPLLFSVNTCGTFLGSLTVKIINGLIFSTLLPPTQLLFPSLSVTAAGSWTPPVDGWRFMGILCQLIVSVFVLLLSWLSLFLLGIKEDFKTTLPPSCLPFQNI